jgi:hypothetical protein
VGSLTGPRLGCAVPTKLIRRVDLNQSVQIPFLIRAEEHAIMRAIGTQEARLSSASRIENLATVSWLLRRQHPGLRKRPPSGSWQAKRLYVARLLPCMSCPFRIRGRTAHVGWASSDRHGGLTTDLAPRGGHLCGRTEHKPNVIPGAAINSRTRYQER